MPNDDLGTFPMPPQSSATPAEPTQTPNTAQVEPPVPQNEPIISSIPSDTDPASPPIIDVNEISPEPIRQETPAFEETPDVIPSIAQSSANLETELEKLVDANESLIEKQNSIEPTLPEPLPEPQPQEPAETPVAATVPPKTRRSNASIIIIILLIVAGIALAITVFLSQQTNKLKTQLEEITQTLESQKTTLTPTPSPSIYEIPTPTISTESGTISTPSATPTISITDKLFPLANATSAFKVAINRSPNAQLILIKVDNAQDNTTAVTKYFFREDLTTKKYFYVAINSKGIPEIIDKQIYVTPDDNIPSLNDDLTSNKLGIDLDEAIRISFTQCANQETCTSSPIKAQYIKTGTGIIWQLSIYTNGLSGTPLMIQINAETKAILYKSPEFANK